MAFKAVLDACVLYKMGVRDALLSVAHVGLFRPLWSDRILAEVRDAWRKHLPTLSDEQWAHLTGEMQAAFPDAEVTGYETLLEVLDVEKHDRHVLAAAIVAKGDAIVTENLRHFPDDYCGRFEIEVIHHDVFLQQRFDLDPDLVVRALHGQASRMRDKPPLPDLLDRLEQDLPLFTAAMRAHLDAD